MNEFEAIHYDEFGFLEDYARHEGIPWSGLAVQRRTVTVSGGQRLSGLVWGESEPELVLLHGIGQNAHTWDSVAMALGRPLVAVDLPGHGHSQWREDADYRPRTSAESVAEALSQLAPAPRLVVGMSLGGLTLIAMAARHPELVPRAVIVDITPGVGQRVRAMTDNQRGAAALLGGPPTFDSFESMLAAAAAAQPGRPAESLRPGVLHNARQMEDGRWGWRYDARRPGAPRGGALGAPAGAAGSGSAGAAGSGSAGSGSAGAAGSGSAGSGSAGAAGSGSAGSGSAGGAPTAGAAGGAPTATAAGTPAGDGPPADGTAPSTVRPDPPGALWDDLESLTMPLMLVRGANSSYIHDDDQAEFARRQPGARIEIVEGSGHSVQSDRATYLAGLIADFMDAS